MDVDDILTSVSYEKADLSHIKQIVDIENICFVTPWSENSYIDELRDERAHYLVAMLEGEVIGYCGYWDIVEEAHITNIAVHPDYRGRGIGCGLLKTLIDYAAQSGIGSFTLEVREDNDAAKKLCEKFGFSVCGTRRNYYQKEKKHALIMWMHTKEIK